MTTEAYRLQTSQPRTINYSRPRTRILRSSIEKINETFTLVEFDSFKIFKFDSKTLKKPISATVTFEDGEFLAKTNFLPLFGVGKTKKKAKKHLKYEINSLYEDLMEDDNFSEEFLNYKKFFIQNIE